MDHKELAEKIRRRIFDQASEDGAIHSDAVDRVIAEVLEKEMPAASSSPWSVYGGGLFTTWARPEPTE